MNSNKFQTIPFQLDEFEFAQAKKLVSLKKGVCFKLTRDDMIPLFSLQEIVKIEKNNDLKIYQIVAYWNNRSLRMGYIESLDDEAITIKNLKNPPEVFSVKRHHILGKAKMLLPRIISKLIILKTLKNLQTL